MSSDRNYVEPDVWECPKCGAPNRPGNGRCWSCGTKETARRHQMVKLAIRLRKVFLNRYVGRTLKTESNRIRSNADHMPETCGARFIGRPISSMCVADKCVTP